MGNRSRLGRSLALRSRARLSSRNGHLQDEVFQEDHGDSHQRTTGDQPAADGFLVLDQNSPGPGSVSFQLCSATQKQNAPRNIARQVL